MSASVIADFKVDPTLRHNELPIRGLRWQPRWRMNNGQPDSFVVPFGTTLPVNLVFHGHRHFDYGHYGIHLGQEDRLTFLGPSDKDVRADFIDCRAGSETLHRRLSITFRPSAARTLIIPPGVAHTFWGLDAVHTINTYGLYLPDPEDWVAGRTRWNIQNDIVNIPLDIADADLPIFIPNRHPASEAFYQKVLERQRQAIPTLTTEFPMTRDAVAEDGRRVRVVLRKKVAGQPQAPDWEPVTDMAGLGWQSHLTVRTGDDSGIVPLIAPSPFYIVDHGEKRYVHDAFGIHVGQEDRLTFVGPPDHRVRLRLVDCRAGSATLHRDVTITFTPRPDRFLVIPPGVAHAFDGLEKVFTINRPLNFLKADGSYRPGSDVIDWPLDQRPFPVLQPNPIPADDAFYERQALAQRELSMEKVGHDTPKVQLFTDPKTGRQVRIALRRRTDGPTDGRSSRLH